MGTGCDTILSQMAADCMGCDLDKIVVYGVDTDQSPYDSGSYASSTTYVTGMAVVKTCEIMTKKIMKAASEILGIPKDNLSFDGERVFSIEDENTGRYRRSSLCPGLSHITGFSSAIYGRSGRGGN